MKILLACCIAVGPLSVALYLPSLPAIPIALGASSVASGQMTLGLYLFGFALGLLFHGPISDSFGRRRVLMTVLGCYAMSSLLCGFATNLGILNGLRFVQGFFASGGTVVVYAILRDQANHGELVRSLALMGVLVPIVPGIAPMLGGILHENLGWRANFFMMAFFGLVLLVFCRRDLPQDETRQAPFVGLLPSFRSFVDGYRILLGDGRYMGAVLPTALLFSAVLCYSAVAPFLFISAMGFSPSHFGLLTSLTVLAIMAGHFLCVSIADKAAETMLVFSGFFVVLFASFLLLLFAETLSSWRLLGPICLLFFGIGFVTPLLQGAALGPQSHRAGLASALMGFTRMFLAGGVSSSMSLIHDGTAKPLALCCLGLSLLGLCCYGLLFARKTAFA